MRLLLFIQLILPCCATGQLSINYLEVKGSRLQVPANSRIIQTDSTESRQSFLVINQSDTIKITAFHQCTWLSGDKWLHMQAYGTRLADECPWYYHPSYTSFPDFVYPPETGYDYSSELAAVSEQHQRAEAYMKTLIATTQAAVDSFALEMEFQNYLRTAFYDMIRYRQSIGDTAKIEASLDNRHLEWKYRLQWQPPALVEINGAHYTTNDHTCEIELLLDCTIKELSTLDIISLIIKNAEIGHAIR
jgi:hypothetical protein